MNWISVKDRLPENDQGVICYFPCFSGAGMEETVVVCIYNNKRFYIIADAVYCSESEFDEWDSSYPTHWIPVPGLPDGKIFKYEEPL